MDMIPLAEKHSGASVYGCSEQLWQGGLGAPARVHPRPRLKRLCGRQEQVGARRDNPVMLVPTAVRERPLRVVDSLRSFADLQPNAAKPDDGDIGTRRVGALFQDARNQSGISGSTSVAS
jgi:hypothetical protein